MNQQFKMIALSIGLALAQSTIAAPAINNGGGSGKTVSPQGTATNNPNLYVAPAPTATPTLTTAVISPTFNGGGNSVNSNPGTGGGSNGPGNSYGPGNGAGQGCPNGFNGCDNGNNSSGGNFNGGGNSVNTDPGTGHGSNGPGNGTGPGNGAGQGCPGGHANCVSEITPPPPPPPPPGPGTGGQQNQNPALQEIILSNNAPVQNFSNNGRELNGLGLDTLEFVSLDNNSNNESGVTNVGDLPPGLSGRTNVYLVGGGIKLQ